MSRQCETGAVCGNTCISAQDVCKLNQRPAPQVGELLAEGYQGTVHFSPDGTQLIKQPKAGFVITENELAATKLMGEAGFGPKLVDGQSGEAGWMAMEKLSGKPTRQGFGFNPETDRALTVEEASRLAEGIQHLHSAGWAHNDLHAQNVLADGTGDAKIIDYGKAVQGGDEFVKAAWRDIANVEQLTRLGGGNFLDLPDLPLSQAVQSLREAKQIFGKSKRKEATLAYEAVLANYMRAIGQSSSST